MKRPYISSRQGVTFFIGRRNFDRQYHPEWAIYWQSIIDNEVIWKLSHSEPVYVGGANGEVFWVYKDYIFSLERILSDADSQLLIMEEFDKERRTFEKLRAKFSGIQKSVSRQPIPETVRIFVWQRDEGKCVKCGSRDKLEYDHIIPIVHGGSNTARNIELLCETCNRSKSGKIQ